MDNPNQLLLRAELKRDEAVHLKPYRDDKGIWTIGVGRNLESTGISRAECELFLDNDIYRTAADLDHGLPWWRQLDAVRQRVLMHMCFDLYIEGLQRFSRMLPLIQSGQYEKAAKCILQSKLIGKTKGHASRLAKMMKTGQA